MKYRQRRRVDWDEEIRKTEGIRRKGLFISALGLGVALVFIFGTLGTGSMDVLSAEVGRQVIFALCFVLSMFILRFAYRRRQRVKREQQEEEQALIIEQMRQRAQKTGEE